MSTYAQLHPVDLVPIEKFRIFRNTVWVSVRDNQEITGSTGSISLRGQGHLDKQETARAEATRG